MSTNPNRIDPLSLVPTVERQTPDNSFGAVLARTTGGVLSRSASFMGGVISQVPVASAAVSGAGSIVGSVMTAAPLGVISTSPNAIAVSANGVRASGIPSSAATPVASAGGFSGGVGTGSGSGDAWELLQAQQVMSNESFALNYAYVGLQKEMEQESRQFNLLSNIMKSRHDTAKASINNIR